MTDSQAGMKASIWWMEYEKSIPSMAGKRIAITGTTSGTGRVAALACLKAGAEVFMLNRESERAVEVVNALQKAVPDNAHNVHHIPCDVLSFEKVREAAKQLQKACQGRLDVLVNNAGTRGLPFLASEDQYAWQMQANHLSHFLLTKEMMHALGTAAEQNGEARIIAHTSIAARHSCMFGGGDIDQAYYEQGGMPIEPEEYHQSKLAVILFTHELRDRLANEKIKALVCHPGLAATGIWEKGSWFAPCETKVKTCVLNHDFQSAQDGAMPLISCIWDPKVKSGEAFVPAKGLFIAESRGPPTLKKQPYGTKIEKSAQKKMWEWSEKAVGTEFRI